MRNAEILQLHTWDFEVSSGAKIPVRTHRHTHTHYFQSLENTIKKVGLTSRQDVHVGCPLTYYVLLSL